MQVIVDSQLCHFDRNGKGKQVLLLHGWADRLQTFHSLQASLSKKFDVISLDLPGFGDSDAPATAWSLDNYVSFVSSFLKKLDIKNLYCVIGHSNGGAIAISGLAAKRLNADKLVLIASAGIRNRQTGRKMALKLLAKSGKAASVILPTATREKLRSKLYKAAGSDMLIAGHMQETFKKIVSQDVQADAKTLKLPTLIIYGMQDTAAPPEYGRVFASLINGSRLELIEGAGHFVHQQHSQRVNQLVKDFLS